jgi:hypothetical protein
MWIEHVCTPMARLHSQATNGRNRTPGEATPSRKPLGKHPTNKAGTLTWFGTVSWCFKRGCGLPHASQKVVVSLTQNLCDFVLLNTTSMGTEIWGYKLAPSRISFPENRSFRKIPLGTFLPGVSLDKGWGRCACQHPPAPSCSSNNPFADIVSHS